jgi:hypothetical protein
VNGELPPFFSSDLSHALIKATPYVKLSSEATEFTPYLYDAASGAYQPLVTPANVDTGEHFGARKNLNSAVRFVGATPDLSHMLLVSPFALTTDAIPAPDLKYCLTGEPCEGDENLYEWVTDGVNGVLHLVNILPPAEGGYATISVYLGRGEPGNYGGRAVSSDGRWVVWTHELKNGSIAPRLYVRDMVGEESYRLGGNKAVYETMSSDGSRIFYLEKGELYEFDTATHIPVDLTSAHGAGETSAGVQDGILGASTDGTTVYIVAEGVLSGTETNTAGEAAVSGQPNVYELHDTGSGWRTTYVVTLSSDDEHDWFAPTLFNSTTTDLLAVTSHVSAEGRWLAFMSDRPLTGYNNIDAVSGVPDEEVFMFEGQTKRLVCVSCNPTGARPHGVFDVSYPGLATDAEHAWGGHWLAGSMPGWRPYNTQFPMYEPRVLFDSGRLFFQSPDALVPQDTNKREDVYEYEPGGQGSCNENSPTFNSSTGGCVGLISSGTSPQESVFYDASEDGNDVFFATSAKLVPWSDVDEATDVYDARAPHVPGEQVGFPEPVKPPPCEGDACQGTAPVVIDQTPASITFQGPGNQQASVDTSQSRKATVRARRCRKGRVLERGRCVKMRKHRNTGTGHKADRRRGGVK